MFLCFCDSLRFTVLDLRERRERWSLYSGQTYLGASSQTVAVRGPSVRRDFRPNDKGPKCFSYV